MPILTDSRQTKHITLKAYPDSDIEIYNSVLAGTAMGIDQTSPTASYETIPWYIKDWNFTNEAKEKMAIDIESLKMFQIEALTELSEFIVEYSGQKKKD